MHFVEARAPPWAALGKVNDMALSRPISPALVRVLAAALATAVTVVGLGQGAAHAVGSDQRGTIVTSSAPYLAPVEPYAGYQPQTRCRRKPRAGVLLLADWLTRRGGGYGPISRACAGSSVSEHKESRAFDWMLDARKKRDRRIARRFLDQAFAPDDTGQPHALARRMGIMYIIWNDRTWASYRGFEPKAYLSSGCRTLRRCSPTLRHRDHMHISLTRKAARGELSWYAAQLAR